MNKTSLLLMAGVFAATQPGRAQLADDFKVPAANCCLANTAKILADQLLDWNQLGRYHTANQELMKHPAEAGRVVFMGDSITDLWKLEDFFPGKPYLNRGIGGQTTPQMLVRMYPDVIELKPAAMVLLAGTNDVARNTGPSTAEMVEQNIMAMTELAQHHGINVVLCSVTPISDYPFLAQQNAPPPPVAPGRGGLRTRMTTGRPPEDILKLNAWMKDYAARVHAVYADYFSALIDEKGWMKDGLANDGLHPNAGGYKIMAPIVSAAIQEALR